MTVELPRLVVLLVLSDWLIEDEWNRLADNWCEPDMIDVEPKHWLLMFDLLVDLNCSNDSAAESNCLFDCWWIEVVKSDRNWTDRATLVNGTECIAVSGFKQFVES